MDHKKRLKFVTECLERPGRFEERERVERQKPCTSATKLVKKKVQTSDGKVSGACFVFPATNRHK